MKTETDWKNIDWGLRDSAIARQIGEDYFRVRRMRKALGIKFHPPGRVLGDTSKNPDYALIDYEGMRDIDIAMEFGISRERARQLRMEFAPDTRLSKGSISTIDWHLADWTLPNWKIAEQLGTNKNTVAGHRRTHNIPAPTQKIRPPWKTRKSEYDDVDWSKTNKELMVELGKSYYAIARARHMAAIRAKEHTS